MLPAPPGPDSGFLGLALAGPLRRQRLQTLQRFAAEYGDVVGFRVGRQRFALLNHPDHVEDILVTRARLFRKGRALERAKRLLGEGLLTSEGAFHLRQRRLAQPAFHRQRISGYGDAMIAHAGRTADRWRDGEEIDAGSEMNRLTLTIVGETLLGTDIASDAGGVRGAVTAVLDAFPITMSPFAQILERLPLPAMRRYRSAQATLDRLVYRIIDQRRSAGDRGDLLSMLLLARDEESPDGSGMTDRQLRDEVMTIFLAGHETTANALTWTWTLLARHPEVERTLHTELDSVLASGPLDPDAAARLPYTRMVIAESLRLYPPAWGIGRRAVEDFTIGGYTIARDTVVLVSQFLLHRDARYYPDPQAFDPERWLPERQASRPKFAYFPFGAGNRVCIGESFALLEAVLVLAALARRWRLEFLDRAPIAMKPGITLRPAGRVRMRVRAR
jgi:cytochrome P450